MTTCEKILVQISEFLFTEVKEINKVIHDSENSFKFITDDEQEFIIEIKQTK